MATMVARLAISPLVPAITAAFDVSNAAVGFALTLMWGAYAITQFPSGVLGGRFGERAVILSAIGITGLSCLFIAVAPSFGFFVVFVILLGCGAGLHYTVATTFITDHFDNIGRAIGVHISGSPIAGLVAPIAAAVIASWYGWRVGILFGAAVAIPIFIAFVWLIHPTEPERPNQSMRERITLSSVLELLVRPSIAFTTVLAFLCAFTWQATASFLPTFFVEGHGLSTTVAGFLFSLYFVVHGITQPLLGWLSDRIGRDVTTALAMGSGVLGYGTLTLSGTISAFIVGVLLIGTAMSWGAPVQSRFMDLFTAREQGAGFGLVRTVYMTTGALGSVTIGFVADLSGWTASFGLLTVIMLTVLLAIGCNRLFRFEL